jgi:hypothetical protein
LGILIEVFPWSSRVDPVFFAMTDEITLTFFTAFSLERLDRALLDAERWIWDRFFEIDSDDAPKATAFRAGTERRVE